MEKIEIKESKRNQKISENTYKLFFEDKVYELNVVKLIDEFEFTLATENNYYNFKNKFNFADMIKTPCFKLEESIEDLNSALIHCILEDKIRVFEKDNFSVLVFESEFNGKKLKSEIILDSSIISETEIIKILKLKVNFLLNENNKKNEKIEFLIKENKENSEKINDLYKDLVKKKDLVNETKNSVKNNELPETVKINKKIKKMKKQLVSSGFDKIPIPQKIYDASNMELQRLKFPLIKNYESQILSNAENEKLLFNLWLRKEFSMDLLYSSSLHGQNVDVFHQRCDGENNTITLIETNKGRRFGGFTFLKFSSENKFENGDGNDFIFSLDKKLKFKNNKNQIYALYNNPNMFPTFGYPSDIYIHKTCFTEQTACYCAFPSSYGVGEELSEPKENYFAGTYNFIVSMIEVFKINFD
jgi:hypothetical protein